MNMKRVESMSNVVKSLSQVIRKKVKREEVPRTPKSPNSPFSNEGATSPIRKSPTRPGMKGRKNVVSGFRSSKDMDHADETVVKDMKNNQNLKRLVDRFMKKKKRKVGREMYNRAYDTDKIMKLGVMSKNGGKVKTWKQRYFVLKPKLLFYFESFQAFEEGLPPKGWIWLRDIRPNKHSFVCTPTVAPLLFLKRNCFYVQKDGRAYSFSCTSSTEKLAWIKAIQDAYERFWTSYNLPVPVPKNKLNPGDDELSTHEELVPIARKLDTYDELERIELENKMRLLSMAQCLARWKAFAKLNKLKAEKLKAKSSG